VGPCTASASSRAAPAPRPTCCGRGSAATGCSGRRGLPAASASTPTTTPSACGGCAPASALADAPEPDLLSAVLAFDDEAAQAILDDAFARLSLEAVLQRIVLPSLREIGARWERGELGVAHEHFAANLIRGRLLGLARRWDQGVGPRALLACAPGDLHDLPLIAFGLALRRRGWRILFLGADTPFDVLAETAIAEGPDVVVVASARARAELADARLARVAGAAPLVLAGEWPPVPVEARRVSGDPVELAAELTA
jgi:MerR family transcriptional regulator, light-induced transcriptional regulator